MEPKKTDNANLESKRFTFIVIGFVIVLGFCELAYEWKQYDEIEAVTMNLNAEDIEEMENTFREKEPPPPPPPPPPEVIEVVEDEVELEEELEIEDIDVDEEEQIEVEVQEEEEEADEPDFFRVVEQMPEFPGGQAALLTHIARNTRYPDMSREAGIQGKVFVQFLVNETGKVIDVEVIRGLNAECDKEAKRVISSLPKWKPGKQRGKAVKVQFTVPIFFKLE